METFIYIYGCTRCKVLLVKMDAQLIRDTTITLEEEFGGYQNDDPGAEEDNEIFMCPICNAAEPVLKSISIPQKLIKKILDLWKILEKEDKHKEEYWYGIPLDEPRLAEIITETML